jgi:cell wall-associated NlpC family hydrolase
MRTTPLDTARPAHTVRRLGVAVAALAGCIAASTAVGAGSAAANPPLPHDSFGSVSSVAAVSGGLRMSGWATDPDALKSNLRVTGLVDGREVAKAITVTSVANSAVTNKYQTGPTPGFRLTIPVPSGRHTVCVAALNVGWGRSTVLKCVPTPLGTTLSSSQVAAQSPRGSISHASANGNSIHLTGWATDPDYVSRPSVVVLYVDGRSKVTAATRSYPAPRPTAAGASSAFDILTPVSVGAHLGCIWVVNVGLGSNQFLGCKSLDTRGSAGTGTVTTPALNTKVVAEAKKHIGQPYVWGATGPNKFDCSGLVLYSYRMFGFTTPRISEDQYTGARLIPASRAVPGDLVFTHDAQGDVYHVGIYTGPGMSVAAIDPSQGVDMQRIWDPSSTTYGSFTHT